MKSLAVRFCLVMTLVLGMGLHEFARADGAVQTLAEVDPQLDDVFNQVLGGITDKNLAVLYGHLYTPMVDKLSKGKGVDSLIKKDEEQGPTVLKTTLIKPVPPFIVFTSKDHDFVIIPTFSRFIMKLSSMHVEAHLSGSGYIVAVRGHGTKKWEFVYDYLMDKDPIDHSDTRTEFFPDLPPSIKMPPYQTTTDP